MFSVYPTWRKWKYMMFLHLQGVRFVEKVVSYYLNMLVNLAVCIIGFWRRFYIALSTTSFQEGLYYVHNLNSFIVYWLLQCAYIYISSTFIWLLWYDNFLSLGFCFYLVQSHGKKRYFIVISVTQTVGEMARLSCKRERERWRESRLQGMQSWSF